MAEPLRVLILDDDPNDAELIVRSLRKAGFDLKWTHAATEPEYISRLDSATDIILSDYAMGQFNAPRALQLLKDRGLEIPFIVVSGTIGEDTAVEMMRLGAADYLLKDRLLRLASSVTSALEQKRLREDKRQAEDDLRAKIHELEQLLAVTVGRENHMVELKKEANALCRELGRPEPYDVSFERRIGEHG